MPNPLNVPHTILGKDNLKIDDQQITYIDAQTHKVYTESTQQFAEHLKPRS